MTGGESGRDRERSVCTWLRAEPLEAVTFCQTPRAPSTLNFFQPPTPCSDAEILDLYNKSFSPIH
jgi:hypothetical protein